MAVTMEGIWPLLIPVGGGEAMEEALARAVAVLQAGGLVAFPTESFYGLGADATQERAIGRLLAAKRRPEQQPILILVGTAAEVAGLAAEVPAVAQRLMAAFWPGGLTLVLEAGPRVSPLLTRGTGRIGIRLSSHPVATALARRLGRPVTGTSANLSGAPACATADAVAAALGPAVDLVLDGGETAGGKGSTVLDVTTRPPRLIREGMVSLAALEPYLAD